MHNQTEHQAKALSLSLVHRAAAVHPQQLLQSHQHHPREEKPTDLLAGFLSPWLLILVSHLMSFGTSFTTAQRPKSWQGMSLLEIYDLFPLVVK